MDDFDEFIFIYLFADLFVYLFLNFACDFRFFWESAREGWGFNWIGMKRELARVLEVKSQLHDSLSRTRASETRAEESLTTSCAATAEDFSCKRFKGTVVNGWIVYSRTRKPRINVHNQSSESENAERPTRSEEPKADGAKGVLLGELIEVVVEDDSNYDVEMPPVKEEADGNLGPPCAEESGAVEVPVLMANGIHKVEELSEMASRHLTRLALKPKAESVDVESLASPSELTLMPNSDEDSTVAVSASTPKNKLELKMSKKIALNKKPTTVKELFDTGLVDGVPVIYMGGKKVLFLIPSLCLPVVVYPCTIRQR